jgi:imidazolonepropionase-like amidohydrolase
MKKLITLLLLLALAVAPKITIRRSVYAQSQSVSSSNHVIERGKFHLGTFGRALGEETFEITRDGDSILLQSNYERSDRGTKIPLTATLRMRRDFTPERFEVKGMVDRGTSIDTVVEVNGLTATIREGKESRRESVPDRFFTVTDYAPVSVQMMLIRYWAGLKNGDRLKTLPGGEVRVERRGRDRVEVSGRQAELDRYSVSGVVWGRETLWFDSDQRLIAAVINGAGVTSLQAVREGYEAALPVFAKLVEEESIVSLGDISSRIKPAREGTFAIVGATLIDGTGSAALYDSAVVIKGGHIAAVGPRSSVKIPEGASVVDGRGKTLLPGLWDMHAHFEQVEWGPTYLAAGVTTVRDVGNEFVFETRVRDALRAGRGLGPRMLLAGIVDGEGPDAVGAVRVSTPEQVRAAVRRYKEASFLQIKIYSSVKPELVPVITAEAHRLGMTVTGHVPNGMNAFEAVAAGMDQINHLTYVARVLLPENARNARGAAFRAAVAKIDPESDEMKQALRFFKEHGTVIDPTVSLTELSWHPADTPVTAFEPGAAKVARPLMASLNNTGLSRSGASDAPAALEKFLAIIGALHRAGVPIVAGTDVVVPGHSIYREMELYVRAGLTPMEAIQSATIVPARAMRLDREVGTVEAGKRADLILVAGNPLESIGNIRKVKFVITGGRMYDCARLWQSVGFRP